MSPDLASSSTSGFQSTSDRGGNDDVVRVPLPPRLINKELVRLRAYAILLTLDSSMILAGFLLATAFRFDSPFADDGLRLVFVVLPVFILFAAKNSAYSIDVLPHPVLGIRRAISALGLAGLMVIFFAFFLKNSAEFSRVLMAGGGVLSAVGLFAGRTIAGRLGRRLYGSPSSEVVIFDNVVIPTTADCVVVHAGEIGLSPDIADPRMLDRLGRLVEFADRVIIACPPQRRAQWSFALKGANVRGEIVDSTTAQVGALGTATFNEHFTLLVSTGALNIRDRITKRLFDLTLSGAALLALAPVLLIVAACIVIEDGGPVLFKQRRLGRGNRLFTVYKFRSMRTADTDAHGHQSATRDDDRVTRVGRFLRRTSIDEIPQLLNILSGEMSFVGPRPHALGSMAGNKLFWEVDPRYWHRHVAKPGLTGLAQVRGFRGATAHQADLVNRLQADLEYLNDWSIWRDIRIILTTFRVVVHHNAF